MKYTRIQSFQHLTELVAQGKSEYITVYGILRCSFSISLTGEIGCPYELFSYVDGSCCRLSAAELEERFLSAIASGRMALEE